MRLKKYYPWLVCLMCMLLAFCAVGCVNSSFGVYFPFMREYAGISNTQCSMITMIRNLAALITMTQVDKYLNKMGVRRGVMFGIGLNVCAMVLYGLAKHYAIYCIAAMTAGMGYALAGLVPISVIISRWFISHRTFAVGLAVMGTGVATVVMPPLVTTLATRYSLPSAFFAAAGIMIVSIMILFFFLPESPSDKGMEPLNDGIERKKNKAETQTTASNIVLTMVVIAFLFMAHQTYGSVPNMSLLFTSEGISKEFAALLISVFGITMTAGKALYGIAVDRFGVHAATIVTYLLNIFGLLFMLLCGNVVAGTIFAIVGCVLFGPGNALATVAQSALASHLASPKDYAKVVKRFQVGYTAGSVLIGPLPGIMADIFGSYVPCYILFTVEMTISMIVMVAAFMMVRKERIE